MFRRRRAAAIIVLRGRSAEERFSEKLFYLTARGEEGKLRPIVEALKEQGNLCAPVFSTCGARASAASRVRGVQSGRRAAASAHHGRGAHRRLLGTTATTEELFAAAEERIAVGNARPELKAMANCVIGENESDAVVRTILEREGL